MYGGRGGAPRRSIASSSAAPVNSKRSRTSPASPLSSTSASSAARRQAMLSLASPKRMRSPTLSLLAGRASARQRQSSTRSIRVASIEATASPLTRTPSSRAGMTRVSLTTSASRGVRKSGRSRTCASVRSPSAPTTSIRALSRGFAGASAMLSGGRTKSKASTRIAVIAILWRTSICGRRTATEADDLAAP